MSKRKKNRNRGPNIPKATIDRARRQAAGEEVAGDAPTRPEPKPAKPEREVKEKPAPARREERRSTPRSRSQGGRARYSKRKDRDTPDQRMIANALAHPTVIVTEEQLREEYSYVLSDLRSMGILAAFLIVVLVILAQFI